MKNAVPGLLEAKSILKNQSWLHNCLGLIYYYTGQTEKSLEEFNVCIKLTPKWPAAWNNIGLVQSGSTSLNSFKQAVDLKYKNRSTSLSNIAGIFRDRHDYDSAMIYLKQSILEDKSNSYPWLKLGDIHESQKNYVDAIEAYSNGANTDKALVSCLVGLFRTYGKLGMKGSRLDYHRV